jgi:hypothetical protein
METALPSPARRLIDANVISEGSGTYYDIRRGRRVPSPKLAVQIFRVTGERFGPIANLTDDEIAVLEKMHG